jgi:hypothetical protein
LESLPALLFCLIVVSDHPLVSLEFQLPFLSFALEGWHFVLDDFSDDL